MQKLTLSFFVASLFVTGCLFPSLDDLQGNAPAKDDPASESNVTSSQSSATPAPDGGADGAATPASSTNSPAAGDASVEAGPRPVASIKCGSATCSGANQFCCGTDGWGGFCKDLGQATACVGDNGLALHCDDHTDCGAGEMCCLDSAKSATCKTSCNGGMRLCRNDSSCPTGQTCSGVIDHLWGVVTNFCK